MSLLAIAAIETVRLAARLMPVEVVSNIGAIVGRRLLATTKRQKRVRENLALALPEKSQAEIDGIARRMWESFGRTTVETLVLDRIAADPDRIEIANPEVLSGPSTGTVFVGMHYGNWECNVLAARGLFPDIAGIYKPFRSARFDAWVRANRAPYYPGGILAGDATALLKAARHIKAGGTVCVLADHSDTTGHVVDFFGQAAPSTAFPAMLGRRFGARIIAARADRLPGTRFRVTLQEVPVSQSGDLDADVIATTQAVQSVFEDWIRVRPASWLWFYKRWAKS